MADTRVLTVQVEDFVRTKLEQDEGQPFSKRVLPLTAGGSHEFDAVSADGMIVASIKSAGGRTSGGKFPGHKVNASIAELYFLTQVPAPRANSY